MDVNNILDGEGAFSPERAGTVPAGDLVKNVFLRQIYEKEVYKKLVGGGGFNGYVGTNDARIVKIKRWKAFRNTWQYWMHSIIRSPGYRSYGGYRSERQGRQNHPHRRNCFIPRLPVMICRNVWAGSLILLFIPVKTNSWLWLREAFV